MPSSNRLNLEQLGRRILAAARDELYLSMRFFDFAFAALDYEMNLNTRYLGTDGDFIYFNPSFLMKQYREDAVLVNRAYLHMVFHCIFRHMAGRGDREEEYWNLACDIAAEALLDSIEDKAVRILLPEGKQELYEKLHEKMKVLTAEGIYHYLKQEKLSDRELLLLEQLFFVDDHQFFEAPKRDRDKKENTGGDGGNGESDGQSTDHSSEVREQEQMRAAMAARSEKWKRIGESLRTNLETFSAEAGTRAGSLLAALRVDGQEECDFADFLQKFCRPKEVVRLNEGEFDTAFYTYGLRLYGNLPLVEPLEYREEKRIEEFVIVVDTSGSCQNGEVREFLKDAFAVLKDNRLFTDRYRVHLLQCDTIVHSDILVTSARQAAELQENFIMRGGGGTDFRAAFDYVRQEREQGRMNAISGLLYFTDGYGTFPEQQPDYDTAFIFWRQEPEEIPVPYWALKLLRNSTRRRTWILKGQKQKSRIH